MGTRTQLPNSKQHIRSPKSWRKTKQSRFKSHNINYIESLGMIFCYDNMPKLLDSTSDMYYNMSNIHDDLIEQWAECFDRLKESGVLVVLAYDSSKFGNTPQYAPHTSYIVERCMSVGFQVKFRIPLLSSSKPYKSDFRDKHRFHQQTARSTEVIVFGKPGIPTEERLYFTREVYHIYEYLSMAMRYGWNTDIGGVDIAVPNNLILFLILLYAKPRDSILDITGADPTITRQSALNGLSSYTLVDSPEIKEYYFKKLRNIEAESSEYINTRTAHMREMTKNKNLYPFYNDYYKLHVKTKADAVKQIPIIASAQSKKNYIEVRYQ